MKLLTLIAVAVFLHPLLVTAEDINAGPIGGIVPQNGDVNCDGAIELTDAVYTLRFLFQGREEPCPFVDSPELVSRIAELENQLAEREAALETCRADLQTTRAQLAETRTTLKTTAAELQTCGDELQAAQSAVVICNTARQSIEGELAACRSDLGTTQEELSTCSSNLQATQSQLTTCTKDLQAIESALAICNDDLASTQAALSTCAGDLQTTQADLTFCSEARQATEAELANCSADLQATESALTVCNDDLASTQAALSTCTATLQSTQSNLADCNANLQTAEADLGTCSADLETAQSDLSLCTTDRLTAESDLADCVTDLQTTRAERDSLQADLDTTAAALVATESELGQCEGDLSESNSRLTDCVSDLSNAQSNVADCQTDLSDCEGDLADTQMALTEAEQRLSELDSEGCTDPLADNFDHCAVIDDGSCEYHGCTDALAENYDAQATVDDGSCEYPQECQEPPIDFFASFANTELFGVSDSMQGGRSGMTHRADNDTLYFVSDDMAGRRLRVSDIYGNLIRDFALPTGAGDGEFDDPEGIAWLGRGTEPSDTFAILDEGDGVNPVRIHVLEITPDQTAITSAEVTTFACRAIPIHSASPDDNILGAEGIAYDPASDLLYVAGQSTQENDGGMWLVDLNDIDPMTGEPAQTLLWRFYETLVDIPGGLSSNHRSRIGDIAWQRIEGCESLLVLTRGDDPVTDNAIWQLDLAGEVIAKFEHGLIDGNALDSNQRQFESMAIRRIGEEFFLSTDGDNSYNANPKKNNLWAFSTRHYLAPPTCDP